MIYQTRCDQVVRDLGSKNQKELYQDVIDVTKNQIIPFAGLQNTFAVKSLPFHPHLRFEFVQKCT